MSIKLILALLACTIAFTLCEAKPYAQQTSDEVNSALENLKASLKQTVKTCMLRISTVFNEYYTVMGGIMDSSIRETRKLAENATQNLQKLEQMAEDQGVFADECLDGITNEISQLSTKNYGGMIFCMNAEDTKIIEVYQEGEIELNVNGKNIGREVEEKALNCAGEEACLRDVLGEIRRLEKEGPNEIYDLMNGRIWNLKELQSKVVVCGFSAIKDFARTVKALQKDKIKCILDQISNVKINI